MTYSTRRRRAGGGKDGSRSKNATYGGVSMGEVDDSDEEENASKKRTRTDLVHLRLNPSELLELLEEVDA